MPRLSCAFASLIPAPPPNVVILPGVDGTALHLDEFVHALGTARTHALSLSLSGDVSSTAIAHQLRPQLRAYSTRPGGCVLVAQSFSGHAALRIAAAHGTARPPGLRGLILVNSFVAPPVPLSALQGPSRAFAAGIMASLSGRAASFLPVTPPVSILSQFLCGGNVEVARELHTVLRNIPSDVVIARLATALTEDYTSVWRDHDAVPASRTLVLRGAADRLVLGAAVRDMKVARPDVRNWDLFDAPHLLLQTHGRTCARLVDDFIAQLPEEQAPW